MTDTLPAGRGPGFTSSVREFFYAEEAPYGLALVRIVLPLVLMIAAVPRWWHARELFSSDGAPTPLWESYGSTGLLPIPSPEVAIALYTAMLFFLAAVSLGWLTRISLIAATVLYAYFGSLDMISTLTKYTCIGTHALFLLSLSQCGRVWSLDAWFAARHRGPAAASVPRSAVWPRRLLQLLVGSIYLAAAVTKMHTPTFFSGDQMMFWVLTEVNFENPIGDYLMLFPAVMPIMAYATIIWEVLFLFVAWRGWGRGIMLSVGVMFHVLTWAMLGLIVFPLVYLSLYLAFLNERDVNRLRSIAHAFARRLPVRSRIAAALASRRLQIPSWWGGAQSAAAFGLLLAVSAVGGVEIEHRVDPYGQRRSDGPYALQQIPQPRAAALLTGASGVFPRDKLFSFDVGSTVVGGILADRKAQFQYGDTAVVQCCLLPPHEDMWVEFNLHDDRDRVLQRNGRVVPREHLRSSVAFRFDEGLPAGEYAWVLHFDGQEVARKPFSLGPPVQQASAVARQ